MQTARSAALAATLVAALSAIGNVDAAPNAGATGQQLARTGYTATHYPIVLMPGLLGFRDLLGFVDYFPGIVEALADGGADVYLVTSSLANSVDSRAGLLIEQLEEIRVISGAAKLNLFAHSQGALEARLIAAERPDLVASVTSIGGPHAGAVLADLAASGALAGLSEAALGALADLMTLLSGGAEPNDAGAALESLSSAGVAAFNARYPAALPAEWCGQGAPVVAGIHYYSWSGVGSLTNPVDLLDSIWVITSLLSNELNDGLVGRCSSHLGDVIRDDYFHNHIDQTNMMFGLVFPFTAKPTSLFRAHANRLKRAGL